MPAMPVPDPASSILALRPSSEGFEVLMVHRNSKGFFGDIVVFPGGRVDDIDVASGHTRNDDVSHRNAAVREFAEETGILLSNRGPIASPGVKGADYYDWWAEHPESPAVDDLILVSRWVTPEAAPRRFDTRFYLVTCVDPPEVEIDAEELISHDWIDPGAALERAESGSWQVIRPTLAHLQWLRRWSSIEKAIGSAEGADGRTLIVPRVIDDGSLLPIHMPAELP